MIYWFETACTNPFRNLAWEEHLLNRKPKGDAYVLFWKNDRAVIAGRHQNVYEEIDLTFAQENGVAVVRRNSGGGAVYHDAGNLNCSVIVDRSMVEGNEFKGVQDLIQKTLQEMGIHAECSRRNDVIVNGKKISGCAQYILGTKALHHGTLLVECDLEVMQKVLTRKTKFADSLSHASMKSRVGNLGDLAEGRFSEKRFIEKILECFSLKGTIKKSSLSEKDMECVRKIEIEKYRSWEWNYGRNPEFNFQRTKRFPGGTVCVNALVERGCLSCVEFRGDFFARKEISGLEKALEGARFPGGMERALENADAGDYMDGVSLHDISSMFVVDESRNAS